MPEIRLSFRSYVPPGGLVKSVHKLLSIIRPDRIRAIEAVILTDSDSIGRGRTQRVRGRKYDRRDCRGFYHPAGQHNTAWIEIVVDNVLAGVPPLAQAIPLVRELLLADTVYHEVGHHLQQTYGAAAGEGVAEKWARRTGQRFLRKHYRWLFVLTWPIVMVYRLTTSWSEVVRHRYKKRPTRF